MFGMLTRVTLDEGNSPVSPARREATRRKGRVEAGAGASSAAPSRQWQRAGRRNRRPAHSGNGDSDAGKIRIELSKSQVDQVVRSAGQGGTMSILLSALRDPDWTLAVESEDWTYPEQMDDRRLSRSLMSGLLVLSCFPPDGDYLGIAEIARMLGMNTSTTHRYVTTLLAIGLIERDPATRKYRVATA